MNITVMQRLDPSIACRHATALLIKLDA